MMQPAKDSIDLGIICGDIQASLHFYQTLGWRKSASNPPRPAPCIACALAAAM